jgi:hypothetical protein
MMEMLEDVYNAHMGVGVGGYMSVGQAVAALSLIGAGGHWTGTHKRAWCALQTC